jgi:hypothetical protein
MDNELVKQKSWWKSNWKWFIPISGILLIFTIVISSGLMGIGVDFAQAYADKELYENALKKVESDARVTKILGEIKPIDKMAILEGEVNYSNDNKSVKTTIRIIGEKGKARMDISANRINNNWNYNKINIRIKNPSALKQTIAIIKEK